MTGAGVRKGPARRVPDSDVAPVVQRVRLRFAKRGRLRFTSHRDIQRALERAIRRCGLPIAYSAGFSPHPKISWAGAVPTGAASECEYVEIGLAQRCEVAWVRERLDAALPEGIDIVGGSDDVGRPLADALVASHWRVRLPGVTPAAAAGAVAALLAAPEASVRRMTKSGERDIDVRSSVLALHVSAADLRDADLRDADPSDTTEPGSGRHSLVDLVVATAVPVVRPDDVIAALVAHGLPAATAPAVATRLSFGTWDGTTVSPLF